MNRLSKKAVLKEPKRLRKRLFWKPKKRAWQNSRQRKDQKNLRKKALLSKVEAVELLRRIMWYGRCWTVILTRREILWWSAEMVPWKIIMEMRHGINIKRVWRNWRFSRESPVLVNKLFINLQNWVENWLFRIVLQKSVLLPFINVVVLPGT